MIQAAVRSYIARGFRVIPMYGVDASGRCLCGSTECNAGKHCDDRTEERWKEGHRYEPQDFRDTDNIAMALGPWQPGKWLVCLDFDGTRDTAPFRLGPLPPTLGQLSPRGLHLFYWVRDYEPLGNWVDVFQSKHTTSYGALDVRYARGKINIAPSRTANGTYQWLEECEPAPLPSQVIHRILDERKRRGLPVAHRWERERGKRP